MMKSPMQKKRRGFTAVEIAMVATVISILALLVLPLYRSRTEKARVVAAEDELASLAKALLLAEADTGFQVRLNDLDNGYQYNAPGDPIDVALEPPIATWNKTLTEREREVLIENWEGPYAAFKRFRFFDELDSRFFLENGGPIYHVIGSNSFGTNGDVDTDLGGPFVREQDRYPVDPWGQPYIFFGRGQLLGTESVFNYNILYSMGPNGLPGTSAIPFPANFNDRSLTPLGGGDDIEYRF